MFVIVCEPHEDSTDFGYGPFESRAEAEAWLVESAQYNIRVGNQPCPSEHPVVEIFTPRADGSIG